MGTLLPVIGLAQGGAQAWADRFSYWPHIGLFAALVWGLGELVDRLRMPAFVPGAVGALVLGSLAALTWAQVGHWRNGVTLWERALAVTKDNPRAHQRLSLCYRRLGRIDEAGLHLREAHRLLSERLHLSARASGTYDRQKNEPRAPVPEALIRAASGVPSGGSQTHHDAERGP